MLLIDGGKVWEDAARRAGGGKTVEKLQAGVEHEAEEAKAEEEAAAAVAAELDVEATTAKSVAHAHAHVNPEELLGGVLPKDMVLPAAIGFLGVVVLGVFIAGRASK